MDARQTSELRRRLPEWLGQKGRELPWRREPRDPYAVWVSEIMCQQTRVDVVAPYFERWMARFPTVQALADAPLDDVLHHWAGLGYYARARNLHRGAQEVVARHGGAVPREAEAVRAIPGVGPYTAGAILSIAFDQPAAILDGNVARVLQRVTALPGAIDEAAVKRRLWELAAEVVPERGAGVFNEAMMELGATVCTPQAPRCPACPVRAVCRAHAEGRTDEIPAVRTRRPPRTVAAVALLVERDDRLLLVRRPEGETLWGGLFEPPWGEIADEEAPAAAARRVLEVRTGLRRARITEAGTFEHVLTHRKMQFRVFRARPDKGSRLRVPDDAPTHWLRRAESAAPPVGLAAWSRALVTTPPPARTRTREAP